MRLQSSGLVTLKYVHAIYIATLTDEMDTTHIRSGLSWNTGLMRPQAGDDFFLLYK